MASNVYQKTSLTGGLSEALDSINGVELNNNDSAVVFTISTVYFYVLNDGIGGIEQSPDLIVPDSNAGNKRWVLLGTGSSDYPWTLIDQNYTASKGERLQIDSTTAITIDLPSNPSPLDTVEIEDARGSFNTNNTTIDPGTKNIRGVSDTLELDVDWLRVLFVYIDEFTGWRF
jgi:hypothetical protein